MRSFSIHWTASLAGCNEVGYFGYLTFDQNPDGFLAASVTHPDRRDHARASVVDCVQSFMRIRLNCHISFSALVFEIMTKWIP
jgi:hypothetical protein